MAVHVLPSAADIDLEDNDRCALPVRPFSSKPHSQTFLYRLLYTSQTFLYCTTQSDLPLRPSDFSIPVRLYHTMHSDLSLLHHAVRPFSTPLRLFYTSQTFLYTSQTLLHTGQTFVHISQTCPKTSQTFLPTSYTFLHTRPFPAPVRPFPAPDKPFSIPVRLLYTSDMRQKRNESARVRRTAL